MVNALPLGELGICFLILGNVFLTSGEPISQDIAQHALRCAPGELSQTLQSFLIGLGECRVVFSRCSYSGGHDAAFRLEQGHTQ